MAERLNGIWQPHEDDEALQKRFRRYFQLMRLMLIRENLSMVRFVLEWAPHFCAITRPGCRSKDSSIITIFGEFRPATKALWAAVPASGRGWRSCGIVGINDRAVADFMLDPSLGKPGRITQAVINGLGL